MIDWGISSPKQLSYMQIYILDILNHFNDSFKIGKLWQLQEAGVYRVTTGALPCRPIQAPDPSTTINTCV